MKLPNKFDRKFKNGVDNFEHTPKSNSWDQVAEKIDQNNNHHFWMASAAAVSLLCIFTFILVQTMSESSTEPVLAVKNAFNSELPKAIPELEVNKESAVPVIIPKMDLIKLAKSPEILEDDHAERSAKVMISLKSCDASLHVVGTTNCSRSGSASRFRHVHFDERRQQTRVVQTQLRKEVQASLGVGFLSSNDTGSADCPTTS